MKKREERTLNLIDMCQHTRQEEEDIMTAVKTQHQILFHHNSSLKLQGMGYIYSCQNIILV